jgi:hypothetical protein
MTHRTKILAVFAVLIVLIGGYAAYWFYIAAQLEKGIDDWAAAQRQAGLTVAFERTPVRGFPFDFQATFRAPHIAGAVSGQTFDWRGADIEAKVSPFDLHAMTLDGPGRHVLDLPSGPVALEAGGFSVQLRFGRDGMLSGASAQFSDARLLLPEGKDVATSAAEISVTAAPAPPKSDSEPLIQATLNAKDLQLPRGVALLTEDPLTDVQLAGTIKGPMPVAPLRDALAAWRDAGGTVEISSFAGAQATLSLAGSATIALDQDLQPVVAANVKARGLADTIDLLASQRRIYPEDALKMKLFVKGAERDAPGGYKEVATGITIQSGYLSWGPFKLARVPPIQWP